MVLPAARAPPAVVVKLSVTLTLDLPSSRLPVLKMLNELRSTAPPIVPDSVYAQYWSLAVWNPILFFPPIAGPIVRPTSVMMTYEPPGITVPKYCMTQVSPKESTFKVEPGIDIAASGLLDVEAKKPSRQNNLMMLHSPISPPTEVWNENVADTPVLPATRSLLDNLKDSPDKLTR
jgi:hypothetical protein